MTSDRERFLAMCYSGPLLQSNAIVVFCGEDALARGRTAVELFRQGAAPFILVSGGLHQPPRIVGADALAPMMLGEGVAPDRLTIEGQSLNTWEQAQHAVTLARANGWERILIVVSPYHTPRALLTCIRALEVAEEETQEPWRQRIRFVPVPASQLRWTDAPTGAAADAETRLELLTREMEKIDRYGAQGHCVDYRQGLDYLRYWESR